MNDIEVTVYFGPHDWFKSFVEPDKDVGFLDLIHAEDERRQEVVVVDKRAGATFVEAGPDAPRPEIVYAYSGDYASVNEHVITNFAGLTRRLNPKRLLLQNPPAAVLAQLERAFSTNVVHYQYPTITKGVLRTLNATFGTHVVGQPRVLDRLLAALYPLVTGRTRPVVVMLFGPSGVGKTETAKLLNDLLGGELMRKQFSMFHSEKFGDYIFGGSHSEVSFARDLLDRSSGVILLDEFDKANRTFHSAFYELFDGGEFRDRNYTVGVGPAVIVCTSNYLSEREIHKELGDALYSRFDLIIEFAPLKPADLLTLVNRMIDEEVGALTDQQRQAVNLDQIRELLTSTVAKATNVRKLKKLVSEVFATQLVHALLDAPEEPPT